MRRVDALNQNGLREALCQRELRQLQAAGGRGNVSETGDRCDRSGGKQPGISRLQGIGLESAAGTAGCRAGRLGDGEIGADANFIDIPIGAKGYVAIKPISIPLVNGESLPVIHMEKPAQF